MPVERRNFLPDFLLQPHSCRHRYNHHDHPDGNRSNRDFYYWRGNTTFIGFGSNKPFGNKIF